MKNFLVPHNVNEMDDFSDVKPGEYTPRSAGEEALTALMAFLAVLAIVIFIVALSIKNPDATGQIDSQAAATSVPTP